MRRPFATVLLLLSSACVYAESGDGPVSSPDPAPARPLTGVTVEPLGRGGEVLREMSMDETHVYWVEDGWTLPEGTLRRMPRAGGEVETLMTIGGHVYGVALDDEAAYLTSTDLDDNGVVVRQPKGGGAPTVLVERTFNPTSITVDDTHVYFNVGAGDGESEVWRVAKTGGTPVRLASGLSNAWDLAVDGEHVYISEMNRGRIVRVRKTGGAPEVIAKDNWIGTGHLAMDETHVFFEACHDPCNTQILYRVGKAGGELDVLAQFPMFSGGHLAVTPDALLWTNYLVPLAGGEPMLLVGDGTYPDQFVHGVTAEPGEAFLGEALTGKVHRVRWTVAD